MNILQLFIHFSVYRHYFFKFGAIVKKVGVIILIRIYVLIYLG